MFDRALELQRIDPQSYPDHASLRTDDICFFLGEYTAHRDYSFSPMNRLVEDFKTRPHASDAELERKGAATRFVAEAFRNALTYDDHFEILRRATLVPIPPSAVHNDPRYDDRMLKLLLTIAEGLGLDVRELVKQYRSTSSARGAEIRPSVSEIAENFYIDDRLVEPCPTIVWIFDDVLTGGNHFKAMQSVITRRFPMASTAGFFIARRVPDQEARLSWREKIRNARLTMPSEDQPH